MSKAQTQQDETDDEPRYPDNPDTHNGFEISKEKYVTEHIGGIGYKCSCGYEGALYTPSRDRPTYHATLRYRCPTPDCRREMESANKVDILDDTE